MLVWRIFDFSTPALAEMMVRGERDRLLRRFREITVFSASLSVVAGALLAVCNGPFVWLWTGGKIHWSPVNDLLLAVSAVWPRRCGRTPRWPSRPSGSVFCGSSFWWRGWRLLD